MELSQVTVRRALLDDKYAIGELRAAAMEPSLVLAGRFDPVRVRERLYTSFDYEAGWVVEGGINSQYPPQVLAYWQIHHHLDHIYLRHLYVSPGIQRLGLGTMGVEAGKNPAREFGLPLRLHALLGSKSVDFYLSKGFQIVGTAEFDVVMEWTPEMV